MDELTLRLECLRLATAARTGNDIPGQAQVYLEWATKNGVLLSKMKADEIAERQRLERDYQTMIKPAFDDVKNEPAAPPPKSANERMNEIINQPKRDKLGLTDAARRT